MFSKNKCKNGDTGDSRANQDSENPPVASMDGSIDSARSTGSILSSSSLQVDEDGVSEPLCARSAFQSGFGVESFELIEEAVDFLFRLT